MASMPGSQSDRSTAIGGHEAVSAASGHVGSVVPVALAAGCLLAIAPSPAARDEVEADRVGGASRIDASVAIPRAGVGLHGRARRAGLAAVRHIPFRVSHL